MNVLQDTILDQRLRAMLVTQETFQLKKYCGMVKKISCYPQSLNLLTLIRLWYSNYGLFFLCGHNSLRNESFTWLVLLYTIFIGSYLYGLNSTKVGYDGFNTVVSHWLILGDLGFRELGFKPETSKRRNC